MLSLRVGSVLRGDSLAVQIGVAPRNLKGGYGTTRWVPVLPELSRALTSYLGWLRMRLVLDPELPLFLSRQDQPNGDARAISREAARLIIHDAFRRAGITNDGRLGTHTLRKTWARRVYQNSGNDIVLLRAALNHSDISVTQRYLEADADALDAAMRSCDFTRGPRQRPAIHPAESSTSRLPIVA